MKSRLKAATKKRPPALEIALVDGEYVTAMDEPEEVERERHEDQAQRLYHTESDSDHLDVCERRKNSRPLDARKFGLPLPFLARRDGGSD